MKNNRSPYQPKPLYRDKYEIEYEQLDENGNRFPYTPIKMRYIPISERRSK